MKSMRLLGNMIEMQAEKNKYSVDQIGKVLDCSSDQVYSMYDGRIFPSFSQLEKLSSLFDISIENLIAGDEQYYGESVVHCMGEFEEEKNREEILDIIDDYLNLRISV